MSTRMAGDVVYIGVPRAMYGRLANAADRRGMRISDAVVVAVEQIVSGRRPGEESREGRRMSVARRAVLRRLIASGDLSTAAIARRMMCHATTVVNERERMELEAAAGRMAGGIGHE